MDTVKTLVLMPEVKGNRSGYRARLEGQEGVRPHRSHVKILHPYPKNIAKGLSMGLIQSDVNIKNINLAV